MFELLSARTSQDLFSRVVSQSVPNLRCCNEFFLPRGRTLQLSLFNFVKVLVDPFFQSPDLFE